VDSAVVELDFDRPHSPPATDEKRFRTVVRGAFAHRRKTLLNALTASFPGRHRDELAQLLTGCGIAPGRRAETLTIDDFLRLSEAFPPDPRDSLPPPGK
jgi:16S rRNA (adenine1518-N6/adenine1519-N6)-dimethyltransferase